MSLELFQLPAIDYRYKAHRFVPYHPTNSGIRPVTFTVESSEEYYDLGESFLEVKVRLNHSHTGYVGIQSGLDASDATDSRHTYIVNNFGHTIFNQMNVYLNQVLMNTQNNAYHYKAYFETLLNYSPAEGGSTLAAQGWVNDALDVVEVMGATGTNDDIPTDANWKGNTALRSLTSKVLEKQWYTFIIRPHVEAFRSGKALAPGVELKMEMYLNSNAVYLLATPNKGSLQAKKFPSIGENDIQLTLHLKKITLNSSVFLKLQQSLSSTHPARYPVVRSEIRTFTFEGNSAHWEKDNVFNGLIPDRVLVAMVDSRAYNGNVEYYPFAFQKFGLTRIRQIVNGEEYPFKSTLELTGNQSYEDLTGYNRLLVALEAYKDHKQPMIQASDWGQGKNCTVFLFNNVPSGDADSPAYRNPRQNGNVRLEMDFRTSPGTNITVIIWSEQENVFSINRQGGIQYNVHQ